MHDEWSRMEKYLIDNKEKVFLNHFLIIEPPPCGHRTNYIKK
jgi:hypothetical protein